MFCILWQQFDPLWSSFLLLISESQENSSCRQHSQSVIYKITAIFWRPKRTEPRVQNPSLGTCTLIGSGPEVSFCSVYGKQLLIFSEFLVWFGQYFLCLGYIKQWEKASGNITFSGFIYFRNPIWGLGCVCSWCYWPWKIWSFHHPCFSHELRGIRFCSEGQIYDLQLVLVIHMTIDYWWFSLLLPIRNSIFTAFILVITF